MERLHAFDVEGRAVDGGIGRGHVNGLGEGLEGNVGGLEMNIAMPTGQFRPVS